MTRVDRFRAELYQCESSSMSPMEEEALSQDRAIRLIPNDVALNRQGTKHSSLRI
jgi:hypothetical protein